MTVTLASIGDGVIATDTAGRVTFLNAEAERLTGWTNGEAEGHPLPESCPGPCHNRHFSRQVKSIEYHL